MAVRSPGRDRDHELHPPSAPGIGAAHTPDPLAASSQAGVSASHIAACLDEVAARFGPEARSTILFENRGKHVLEVGALLASLPPGGRVLDVGGGMGVNLLALRRLAGPEAALHLVDRFDEYADGNPMGEATAGWALLRAAGVQVTRLDFWASRALPFAAASFDVVTLFDVMEHLPGSPAYLLAEARRVLRPGGILLAGGPNATSLLKRAKLALGRHPYMPFDLWVGDRYFSHYREYSAAEYAALLRRAGFEVERLEMASEPSRTRARYRHLNGQPLPLASGRTLAVYMVFALESALPSLRSLVYLRGRKPAA